MNDFGRFIRKYRVDISENLSTMANHLEIPISVLSAYETGRRKIQDPDELIRKISKFYKFDKSTRKKLEKAVFASISDYKIDMSKIDPNCRDDAVALARNIGNLSADDIKRMMEALKK